MFLPSEKNVTLNTKVVQYFIILRILILNFNIHLTFLWSSCTYSGYFFFKCSRQRFFFYSCVDWEINTKEWMNGRGCRRKGLIIVSVSRFCRYCVIVIKMYYIVFGRENEYFFVLVNENLFLELCHPITVSIRSTVRMHCCGWRQ